MEAGTENDAPNPPQAQARVSRLPVLPAPNSEAHPMFARIAGLAALTGSQLEHLAAFNVTRAIVNLDQGSSSERRALGHLMPDFYARAVALVGAGHISATIEQEGMEPFFFAFETQEPADQENEPTEAASQEETEPTPRRRATRSSEDALFAMLEEMRQERKEAREREERREAQRDYERREQQAARPAVDPFVSQLQARAQELQLKMMDKASRAIDEATNPDKKKDDLTSAVEVIERLATVRTRADAALAQLTTKPETLAEPDLVDMFERVSGNPLAQAVAKKFFKLDSAAPALPAPDQAGQAGPDAPPAVNETPNPFAKGPTGAAANG